MKGPKGYLVAFVCLWMAGGCQMALAPRIGFAGAVPDFVLIVLVCLSLSASRRGGAGLGFAAGIVEGAVAGANLSAYAVTRTLVGFMIAWSNDLEFEGNLFLAAIIAASSTVVAQFMLMFGVHRGPLVPFLTGTLVGAVYNGVVAMPVYWVIRRFLDPPGR